MLSKLAEQQLRKAGWYPGRKVDISDQIEFWESCGYQTFDAAVKFIEEFGKLHIVDEYVSTRKNSKFKDEHTTYVTEILDFYNELTDDEKFEFNLFGRLKEPILPVICYDGGMCYFISESGIFYCEAGLIAESAEEIWNDHYALGRGESHGIALPWNEIGTGKKRKIVKSDYILREYI